MVLKLTVLHVCPCFSYAVTLWAISHNYSTFLWRHIACSALPDPVLWVPVAGGQPGNILQLPCENPSGSDLGDVGHRHNQMSRILTKHILSFKMFTSSCDWWCIQPKGCCFNTCSISSSDSLSHTSLEGKKFCKPSCAQLNTGQDMSWCKNRAK